MAHDEVTIKVVEGTDAKVTLVVEEVADDGTRDAYDLSLFTEVRFYIKPDLATALGAATAEYTIGNGRVVVDAPKSGRVLVKMDGADLTAGKQRYVLIGEESDTTTTALMYGVLDVVDV